MPDDYNPSSPGEDTLVTGILLLFSSAWFIMGLVVAFMTAAGTLDVKKIILLPEGALPLGWAVGLIFLVTMAAMSSRADRRRCR